jgi:MGT family glycosyltransferase
MLFSYPYLVAEPLSLIPIGITLPPAAFHVRRSSFDQSGDEVLPKWVANLSSQPVIFATLGTLFNKRPGQFENILEALKNEPLELILAVGRDRDPTEFGEQPSNVHIERYIPESLVFPYCDLVVSHCGSGTIMAALEHGLPLVNLPIFADQPENAALCAELGVGVTVPMEERTPETIRAAVQKVLSKPDYHSKAKQIQSGMQALPELEAVTNLLEKLVSENKQTRGK